MNTAEWAKSNDADSKPSEARYKELMDAGATHIDDERFCRNVKALTDKKEQMILASGLLLRAMATLGATLGMDAAMHVLSAANGAILKDLMGDCTVEKIEIVRVRQEGEEQSSATNKTVH